MYEFKNRNGYSLQSNIPPNAGQHLLPLFVNKLYESYPEMHYTKDDWRKAVDGWLAYAPETIFKHIDEWVNNVPQTEDDSGTLCPKVIMDAGLNYNFVQIMNLCSLVYNSSQHKHSSFLSHDTAYWNYEFHKKYPKALVIAMEYTMQCYIGWNLPETERLMSRILLLDTFTNKLYQGYEGKKNYEECKSKAEKKLNIYSEPVMTALDELLCDKPFESIKIGPTYLHTMAKDNDIRDILGAFHTMSMIVE